MRFTRKRYQNGVPLGCAIAVLIGALAKLERNLIIERVRAGMRRTRLEGRQIGRNPLELDHAAIQCDRCEGQSLRAIAKNLRVSAATVWRVLHEQKPQLPEKQPERHRSQACCLPVLLIA